MDGRRSGCGEAPFEWGKKKSYYAYGPFGVIIQSPQPVNFFGTCVHTQDVELVRSSYYSIWVYLVKPRRAWGNNQLFSFSLQLPLTNLMNLRI